MTAAQSAKLKKHRAKRPLGAGVVTLAEMSTARSLKALRGHLQLPDSDFAKLAGVTAPKLMRFDTEMEPWPTANVAKARAALTQIHERDQLRIDEAGACLAELESLSAS